MRFDSPVKLGGAGRGAAVGGGDIKLEKCFFPALAETVLLPG